MNRFVLAALIAVAAGASMPSFAHRGGGPGGGFHGGGFRGSSFHGGAFHGGAFQGQGFARPVPFRGVAAFPNRGFFPNRAFFPRHHHRSTVFVGAGFAFPAYYYPAYGPAYYPAYYAPPVYYAPAIDPSPVVRLYCPDPAGYFPEVRDCNQDWVQVPQEQPQAP